MTQMTSLLPSLQNMAPRRMRWLACIARILLWLTVAAWLLFGASWAVLHGWIVPRIGEFRPRLEMEASKTLGVTVRIGEISAKSGGLIPSFELRDVVLLDMQGREALRLPRVLAALSPSSLWGMGFEQLFIDQPALEIRRAADGKIYVGGLDVSQNQSGNAAADWIFSQAELSIKGGTVRWTDELRRAPPLALSQVDAVLRNGHRRHLMRLDATPPSGWGERFSLRGIFRQPLLSGDAGQWMNWSGQMYAEFSRVDVSRIKDYASLDSMGVDLRTGNGSLRAWADVSRGQVTGATADVALAEVDAQLGKALEPLALESVMGRFGGRQLADGFEFSTEGLRFSTKDGLRWPGGNLALVHTGTQGQTAQQNELKADNLDLAAVAQIANRLPLGTPTHALVASYAPKGLVETIEARWQIPVEGAVTFAAKGRATGLELASLPNPSAVAGTLSNPQAHEHPGRPGVSGAAIDFDVTQAGGKATVSISRGALDLPGVFEDPRIVLDKLSLDAQWKLADGKIDTQLRNIKFSSADADGVAQASWQSGTGTSLGVLDLQGSLSRGDGARVHRYLPLVLPDGVRHYVRDAVVQGAVSDVKFRVKGPVDHIPFSDPAQGEFKVSAKVKNGTFAYVPASAQPKDAQSWPVLTDVQGELVFNRAALEVNSASARVAGLAGLQVVKADARIPDLMHSATLDLGASIKGPLADALGFVNASPIGGMTGQALAKAVASGSGDYGFHLNLPLHAVDKTRVQGTVSLPGNDVQFTPASPALARLKGVVTFSETGFNVVAAQARMLGGDIRFEGGMRAPSRTAATGGNAERGDGNIEFKAQGTLTAEGLRQAKDLGFAAHLAQNASGSAAYSATLGFRRGVTEVVVSSNLQGMALSLPAPLNKNAETALPLRFENTLLRESLAPGQKLQDQLALTVGSIASVVYVRDVSGEQARVVRGGISVGLAPGESVPLPDSGVAANINLARVDLDAWEKALSAPGSGGSSVSTPAAPGRPLLSGASLNYLPTQMAIRARELQMEGHRLNNVVVGGTREGLNWRANIDATELNGYVEFRQPGGAGAGRVFARLSRLNLGQSTASDVETILDEQPANIPALDVVVDDLELRGKKLGRVEIDAVNRGASVIAREGGVREWRLNKLNITMPEAVLTATGNWVAVNAQASAARQRGAVERRRTVMNFKLDIVDSGELLRRFGMGDVVRRGKGKMEGQVAWIGSPMSLDYPSMSGQFNVNIESGQFLKADPGIAKLLGVLSLQSLPRRLTLDFRDVFSEGFAFDFVRGDVNINQGVAATNNLQMKGVNAAVLMEGSADIARETQDIKVVVVPEINAGTASLIATVINPAIGLGSFLAQYFLRRPLIQATTQEFHIDGSWADPKITKVERKP
ncbi:hypothetical protein D9M73_73440 [compost metagenome]